MKKTIRLTERDLTRIVKRIINEQKEITCSCPELAEFLDVINNIQSEMDSYPPKIIGTFEVSGNQITLTAESEVISPLLDDSVGSSITLTVTK